MPTIYKLFYTLLIVLSPMAEDSYLLKVPFLLLIFDHTEVWSSNLTCTISHISKHSIILMSCHQQEEVDLQIAEPKSEVLQCQLRVRVSCLTVGIIFSGMNKATYSLKKKKSYRFVFVEKFIMHVRRKVEGINQRNNET